MKKAEKELEIKSPANNTIDVDLEMPSKKRIRINGDDNLILYINTQDMLAMDRFRETYPKLIELANDASAKLTDDFKDFDAIAQALREIDTQMKEYMDYIFNANVSETCCADGSMYDPFDGQFRFEHIFEVLFKLYSDSVSKEFSKMATRIKRHTDKYTK